jgi:hypothetical protein
LTFKVVSLLGWICAVGGIAQYHCGSPEKVSYHEDVDAVTSDIIRNRQSLPPGVIESLWCVH